MEEKEGVCLRPLRREDYDRCGALLAQVHALHVENRPDLFCPARPEALAAAYRADAGAWEALSLVAERAGTPVGVCLARVQSKPPGPILAGGRRACVEALGVAPSEQGRGTGTLLLRRVLEQAAALGVDRVELSVQAFNGGARALYDKMGFQVQSYHMEYQMRQE